MGSRRTGAAAPGDSHHDLGKGMRWTLLALAALAALILLALLTLRPAAAQGVLADGDAAVTGFSGALPPPLIAPGQDPAQATVIDPAGASLRVIQLQAPGGAPQGQVAQAPKGLSITAAQIGQVFAVALDNANPPNIYAAATSAYGLPIVGANGQRLAQGAPGAQFMPGLFGQGGAGAVWRIDGQSGEARLFATIAFENTPNGGAALGGLAFDPASRTLYVADRETGMIHAFDPNGAERGRYDHGFTGREAGGLPQVQFDPSLRGNIASPQFQPLTPATWGLTPPSRRVFGLAVHEGRLYYAVAENLQIWSVSITPDGGFGTDARVEVAVAAGQGPSEIAKIAFDDTGRMLLAERAPPSVAADFAALTAAGGRVLRYTRGPTGWTAEEFAVGFGAGNRGGNGGVALGYGYANGQLDRNACAGFVWMSGEQLRVSADPQGGPANVNGLQGSAAEAVLPANAPLQSWFVDLDDRFEDANARGQAGDVAIRRDCAPGGLGAPPPGVAEAPPPGPPGAPEDVVMPYPPPPGGDDGPGWFGPDWWPADWGPPPPPPACPPGTHVERGLRCCPWHQIPGPFGDCGSPCANGSTAPADMLACERGFQPPGPGGANPGTCWNGTAPVSVCAPNNINCKKCPKSPLKVCPAGFEEVVVSAANPVLPNWWWSDRTCRPTATQLTCGAWQQVALDGTCQNLCPPGQWSVPLNRCCLNGTAPNAQGQCGPGIVAPPQWFLDYLATGTGPCIPPNCSFYEFTITGKQRFGRGALTQRITVPPASQMTARVTRGGRYCPPSAWTCGRSGNTITCSVEDCGLAPGEQVVVRLEGLAAPELKEPPPQPTERTACGQLTWHAAAGPGPATTAPQSLFDRIAATRARPTPPTAPPPAGTPDAAAGNSQEACWSIPIPARETPACPPNYVRMPTGQCCLASQVADGVCCPAGQRPDPRRRTCVPVTTVVPPIILPPVVTPPPVVDRCPPGRYWDGQRCVRGEPPCPPGTIRKGRRCVPVGITCPPGTHLQRGRCVPDVTVVPCPPGTVRKGPRCVPLVTPCPPGTVRKGPRCVPVVTPCPPGTRRVGPRCVPIRVITCPPGTRRLGDRCVTIARPPVRPIRPPARPLRRPGPY
ncbi:MAG: hypothetical protein M5U08_26460 [Burkholderiales bacterium]|nr:hypothetical protein [Burkholderiales bacterium]